MKAMSFVHGEVSIKSALTPWTAWYVPTYPRVERSLISSFLSSHLKASLLASIIICPTLAWMGGPTACTHSDAAGCNTSLLNVGGPSGPSASGVAGLRTSTTLVRSSGTCSHTWMLRKLRASIFLTPTARLPTHAQHAVALVIVRSPLL